MKKQLHIEIPIITSDLHAEMQENIQKLEPVQKLIQGEIDKNSQSDYAFAYTIDDESAIKQIHEAIEEKKKLNPSMLIVIGIGGSNLGTVAVQEALRGTLYNESTQGLKIYYADTVDTDYLCSILELTEIALKKGSHILLNVISKSGNTTETIAVFELFSAQLKRYRPDTYAEYIVCTTDQNSPLHQLATEKKLTTLMIPAHVGGRYSVLTAVSLFPLGMLYIEIDNLLRGARDMRTSCLQNESSASHMAAWNFTLAQEGYHITNLFLFSNELRGCGAWWRQLTGESLGKAQTSQGEKNTTAIIPIVSIGTTDLHSVGQLYLAGIANIATQFVYINKNECILTLPDYAQDFDPLVPHIQEKSISHIMHAITIGVQKAYQKRELPFCTITLPEKSAYYIGQFLMHKMFETVFLAYLLDVHAFDQPEVELYKKEVRSLLARE